jgi:hypothetical protein
MMLPMMIISVVAQHGVQKYHHLPIGQMMSCHLMFRYDWQWPEPEPWHGTERFTLDFFFYALLINRFATPLPAYKERRYVTHHHKYY